MSKYPTRKQSEVEIYFKNSEDRDSTLENMSQDDFMTLTKPYFGKPMSYIINILRVKYETFYTCCEIYNITECFSTAWKSNKRSRTDDAKKKSNKKKKINNEDFIVGTYDDSDEDYEDYEDYEDTITETNKKSLKKKIDSDEDYVEEKSKRVIIRSNKKSLKIDTDKDYIEEKSKRIITRSNKKSLKGNDILFESGVIEESTTASTIRNSVLEDSDTDIDDSFFIKQKTSSLSLKLSLLFPSLKITDPVQTKVAKKSVSNPLPKRPVCARKSVFNPKPKSKPKSNEY